MNAPAVAKQITLLVLQNATGGWDIKAWNASFLGLVGSGIPVINKAPNGITVIILTGIPGVGWYISNSRTTGAPGGGKFFAKSPVARRIVAGAVNNTALTSLASVASRIQFIPFVPAQRMVVTEIGINVVTLLAGTATVGIYSANGDTVIDMPGTKIGSCADGAISTATAGTKMAALTAAVTLEAGTLYFLAVICTAAVVLRTIPLAGQENILGFADNTANAINSFWAAGATNVLPAAAPAVASITANAGVAIPALYLTRS